MPLAQCGGLYLELAHNFHRAGLGVEARRCLEMARGLSPRSRAVHEAYELIRHRPEEIFFSVRAWSDLLRLHPDDEKVREGLRRARAGLRL